MSGAAYGTELVTSAEPTVDTVQSFTVTGLTRAQLLNGALGVRVRASRANSNTAFTASLDAVSVTVDYTAPQSQAISVTATGATTARGADTFTYDQANRLTSATVAGVTETYTYDGDGVRFSRQTGAGPVTRYVTDPAAGLPVTLDDGTHTYVWGQGLAYAMSGGTLEVYHTDRLGSVRAITDAAGAVTATYRTDEFGVPTATTGTSTQPFAFTGEPRDASGLSYLRARAYDPSLGRFMSRDTWHGTLGAPQTLDRYVYVGNNPTTDADPSGHDTRGACVTFEGALAFLFGEGALCVVVSDSGQSGVIFTLGAGGGAGLGMSAGVAGLYSNAGEIYDLGGPFFVTGGSGAAGIGLQGEAFVGGGHCGQIVAGGMGGPIVGATGSAQGGATGTKVLLAFGPPKSRCGRN